MNHISSNPIDRLTPQMLDAVTKKDAFFDVHTHIFNYRDVPNGFLGIRVPFKIRFLKRMEHLLHRIIKRSDSDVLSNLAYFINFFRTRSSEETTQKLLNYYSSAHLIFCPLMMDMAPGIKGKIVDNFDIQIEKVRKIRDRFPDQILPFLAIDPRNTKMKANFIKVFSSDQGYKFNGIKIYPSLGYLPSHPDLMEIYEICEKKRIPVTTHCASAIIHASLKTIRNIEGWHFEEDAGFSDLPVSMRFSRRKDYAEFFNHPRNWKPVLQKFPQLKLNLAHFGGDEQWEKFVRGDKDSWVTYIIELMEQYPNVYSDFSYTFYDPSISGHLKETMRANPLVASRVLYGSDYYMVVKEGHFRAIKENFIALMGDEVMKIIANVNPKRFLFE